MSLPSRVLTTFKERYHTNPTLLIRAPGRVNLIGEHTDYNDGFVLPMAIDRNVWIAASPRNDSRIQAYSIDLESSCTVDVSSFEAPLEGWGRYVQAVAWALSEEGCEVGGWNGVIGSDVPMGSGLSSSAALELAVARCFIALSDAPWNAVQMARLCQHAENNWVGMNCGIMDQLIVAAGERDHALLIDCRSLALAPASLPADTLVVIMDTATRRGLVDSAYNERRKQCEAASAYFGVPFLRDLSMAQLEENAALLEKGLVMRSRHVISENQRTEAAFEAMQANDAHLLGRLMNESHYSLRDDYEVTNNELNVMVEHARSQPACFGARMTGAGFGGCAIALVEKKQAVPFIHAVHEAYQRETSLTPLLYACDAERGVSVEAILH